LLVVVLKLLNNPARCELDLINSKEKAISLVVVVERCIFWKRNLKEKKTGSLFIFQARSLFFGTRLYSGYWVMEKSEMPILT